jgi:thioredoxin-related protein
MFSRRQFIAAAGAASLAQAISAPAVAQTPAGVTKPHLAEDGMYHFDWYLESFLDTADDIATARQNNKRLAVIWSQKGCIYCKQMAEQHFQDPKIVAYVRENFEVVHLNLFGSREVTDLDGKKRGERATAQMYGVRLTPTIQFFPESAEGLSARPPLQREAARMPGLLEPAKFLAMFQFVREKGYEKMSFDQWLKRS